MKLQHDPKEMVEPLSFQNENIAHAIRSLKRYRVFADTSDTGTGKTYTACFAAGALQTPLYVVCPKSVIPTWKQVAADVGARLLDAVTYESLRQGKRPPYTCHQKAGVWKFNQFCILVFDEAHRVSGLAPTLQSEMATAAFRQGFPTMLLSATLADHPRRFHAIGEKLGLFVKKDFHRWTREMGVDYEGQFDTSRSRHFMRKIRERAGDRVGGIRIENLPEGAFPDNHVFTTLVPGGEDLDGIFTEAFAEALHASPNVEIAVLAASNIFRQAAENSKVSHTHAMAYDLVRQGYSVAIFTTFLEPGREISRELNAPFYCGATKDGDRVRMVREFQADRIPCIVLMQQAGGICLSLHDLHGNRPRVALVMPSGDAKQFKQTLGRIHRTGGETPCTQQVIFAAGSDRETRLRERLNRRLGNIAALNDADLAIQLDE